MESVVRAVAMYLFLLLVMRIAGKRSFAEITSFDFVLLLVIGEATQQALVGEDFSLINAMIVIGTLIAMDIGLSLWKQRSKRFERLLEDQPLLLVVNGDVLHDRLQTTRVGLDDILSEARATQGLERLDQIKYAVLERNGAISIVPREGAG